jgi:hypothetical protein
MTRWPVVSQGDPNRLTNGSDYEGRACGTNGQPGKVYYPRITEDIVAFVKEKRTNLLDVSDVVRWQVR